MTLEELNWDTTPIMPGAARVARAAFNTKKSTRVFVWHYPDVGTYTIVISPVVSPWQPKPLIREWRNLDALAAQCVLHKLTSGGKDGMAAGTIAVVNTGECD